MNTKHDHSRWFGPGAIAVIGAVLLVAVAGAVGYRSVASGSRAEATPPLAEPAEVVFVSREAPRARETAAPVTGPAAPSVASPPATSLPQPVPAGMDQPFIEARQEARDSIWALQTESGVRDGLAALREKKVALQSVQCASIRCTLEGTIDRGGDFQDVVRALNKAGLKQGRFKRTRDGEGRTTFSAVFARQGYALDGSPKEVAAETL
jgi:hypothetical protein